MTAVKTSGADSEKSLQLSKSLKEPIRITATKTSAGAVAYGGMARMKGATNSVAKTSTPTTIDVRPVRPPTEMPVVLSIYEVVVEVPLVLLVVAVRNEEELVKREKLNVESVDVKVLFF